MSEEKTKEPTEKKLKDAREDGEVAKSTDLTGAVVLLVVLTVLLVGQHLILDHVQAMIAAALNAMSGPLTITALLAAVQSVGRAAIVVALLIAAAAAVAAIAALLPQVGFQIAVKPVIPKPDNINPAQGLQRLFSAKSFGELARSVIKALIIGAVMFKVIILLFPLVAHSVAQPLPTILQVAWSVTLKLCFIAGTLFFIIGVVDYKFQKWIFIRQHRMSDTDLKQEHKEMEGEPKVKETRRRLAREIAFSPSLKKAIASANALVTNPTHYAVAIRYMPSELGLPRVVAKGSDELAMTLRRLAREAHVPIIGNPRIARALFKVPLQQPVPEELFEAVAAILKWVEGVANKPAAEDPYAQSP